MFGIAECLRRFPWIFFSLYLLLDLKGIKKYHFIRVGLSFAFIAHGFASLGFLGLNQGHIDLAIKVVPIENARNFVYCTGITDSIIGLMLLQGVFTRYFAAISIIWISFIVYLSYLSAIPDAIFRSAFLIAAIYVFIDKRTYFPKLINYEKN
ncbi:MAG: DoxX family membrane protein [Flavobacteriales bacterium]|nr:DoxX family membrane protein [Flavobacteriales bacterium]